ncbi:hypothetical protein LSAT2_019441, partial [Lamellibrachia satsuma]
CPTVIPQDTSVILSSHRTWVSYCHPTGHGCHTVISQDVGVIPQDTSVILSSHMTRVTYCFITG